MKNPTHGYESIFPYELTLIILGLLNNENRRRNCHFILLGAYSTAFPLVRAFDRKLKAPIKSNKKGLVHNTSVQLFNDGAPGGTRTHNPQIRSLILYPVELRAHSAAYRQPGYYSPLALNKQLTNWSIRPELNRR